jgi:hypothetical protein
MLPSWWLPPPPKITGITNNKERRGSALLKPHQAYHVIGRQRGQGVWGWRAPGCTRVYQTTDWVIWLAHTYIGRKAPYTDKYWEKSTAQTFEGHHGPHRQLSRDTSIPKTVWEQEKHPTPTGIERDKREKHPRQEKGQPMARQDHQKKPAAK